MARILLGVTGGIAAYKALELTRLATKAGHAVRVIQTEAAQRFVGAASFAAITGAPVLVSEFARDELRGAFPGDPAPAHAPLSHLALVDVADVYVIAPASANTLAKLAGGHADNLLTSAALACRRPLVVAPAMNDAMYEHPATQASLRTLRARGVEVLEPGVGALGSPGEWGVGRLPEPPDLLAAVERILAAEGRASAERSASGAERSASGAEGPASGVLPAGNGGGWAGLRVLVTAGGTREPIDAVRYLGNRSSGRMGFALAGEAARRGAEVTVVAANVGLARDPAVRYLEVQTTQELLAACEAQFDGCDVLLMAAAVADFRPQDAHPGKIKKLAAGAGLDLRLVRTPDVLATLADRRRADQLMVGFAAEHGPQAVENAREKLERKRLDAVVVNDVSQPGIAFDAPDNEVVIVTREGDVTVPKAAKEQIARAILDVVLSRRSASPVKVAR